VIEKDIKDQGFVMIVKKFKKEYRMEGVEKSGRVINEKSTLLMYSTRSRD